MKKLTKAKQKKLERRELNKKDKDWALKVKELFGNKCAICGATERLNSHHIIPRVIKETRHLLINGVCCCAKCHRFSYQCSAHQSPFVFYHLFRQKFPDQDALLHEIALQYGLFNEAKT